MRELNRTERDRLCCLYAVRHSVPRQRKLFSAIPDPGEILALVRRGRTEHLQFLRPEVLSRLIEASRDGFADRIMEKLTMLGADVVFFEDADYPVLLKEISDPPAMLFYKGRLPEQDRLSLAVVGTRRASDYGIEAAKHIAHELAGADTLIVSGLALGIDTAAARGALEADTSGCVTAAVLGCGIDVLYPRENRALFDEIAERGVIISEFWPATGPERYFFPIRNRIMAGMTRGTLVVEAGERSGARITARLAREEGREVFAVPGRIFDPASVGTNEMIRMGEAIPVASAEHILAEFGIVDRSMGHIERRGTRTDDLSDGEKRVVAVLCDGEKTFDEIADETELPAGMLNSYLTALEFSGIMKQLPGRMYELIRT